MIESSEGNQQAFQTAVPTHGSSLQLPVSFDGPLFVVGPNGAGKSGLMLSLYRANVDRAVRIAAHRQTWMESNSVPFSPEQKIQTEANSKAWDSQSNARWRETNPSVRSGLILADLIEADNNLSRKVREAVRSGKSGEATQLANALPPLETINELLAGSGIPIAMMIEPNSTIVASKRGGPFYSIAALSDGERAALLVAGLILTAKSGSLILVDEPERHLHPSIVTPLLLQLFAKRPDCAFVVSTHELNLPVCCPFAKTVLVRDSKIVNDDVTNWDLDVLEPGFEIDDATKEAIIGSRRKILFIEGNADSLDKPLYEILFPGVSIFPRGTCSDVQHAVTSVRDTSAIAWVQAYGIVDQDHLTEDRKLVLKSKGVFALSVYSVEALYYNLTVVKAIADRQCNIVGGDPEKLTSKAWADLLASVASDVDRLAARMTEQAVKDQVSLGMLDWKKTQAGQNVNITVDAQSLYRTEKARLQTWISLKDVDKIMARYPIRETTALNAVVVALQFKNRVQYEAAVRKLVIDDATIRSALAKHFGELPAAMA